VSALKPLDRLVTFTDAVVAIAITLLVLPLVDAVGESVAARVRPVEVITENQPQIYSFLLSFAVIARLWVVHRRMFEKVVADSTPLLFWSMAWLLTIVVLPFPTEMIGGYGDDWFTAVFYVGTILASSVCLSVLAFMIHGPVGASGAVSTTAILVVAFVLTALVPGVTYFALLLLVFSSLLNRVVTPLLGRVEERRAARQGLRPTPPT
jgi:uncharacterized membrane protein